MNKGRGMGPENMVAASLGAAVDKLHALPESAHVRELRAKAVAYEQVVIRWKVAAPSEKQVETMIDFVVALHGKILAAKNSLRRSSIRGEAPFLDRPRETRDW